MSSLSITADAPARVGLHRVFWRVHFWAGLITAPLVLFAAATGLLYILTPQIEARWHADVDQVPVSGNPRPLDAQWAAAKQAVAPGWTPRSIVPGHAPGQTTQVLFTAPPAHAVDDGAHAAHAAKAQPEHDPGLPAGRIVYVNPHTAQVVGSLAEMDRFKTWSKKLHSSALQGNGWRWLIELAASWMLVMLATGITMAWPRSRAQGGPGWRALVPHGGRGRASWRAWHVTVGGLMSGLLMVVLVTGLTWSRQAGDNFRAAQEALGQASPKWPQDLRSSGGGKQSAEPGSHASLQTIFDTARAEIDKAGGPSLPLQMTPPKGDGGVWRVDRLVGKQPGLRLTLALDADTGRVLYRSGWDELPLLAQATAVGIPFHRAEFGVWNQVVLSLVALATIFSVVSGVVMGWQRRPAGGFAAPAITVRQVRAVPLWLWLWLCLFTLAMAFALPVFGASLAVLVSFELLGAAWRLRRPPSVAA